MSADMFADAFHKMLADACPPSRVRAIEAGEPAGALWHELQDSGFADALLTEARGGAALTLAEALPLLLACGTHALPLPLAFTMIARAVFADAGKSLPDGPITLASATPGAAGDIACRSVSWGLIADWVLVDIGADCVLLPTAAAIRERAGPQGSQLADLIWRSPPAGAERLGGRLDLRNVSAALLSAHLAGAMIAVLERTVAYANERKQFGKSIGKFQAIQQQLSVMAEQVFAARMAAELGCRGGWRGRPYLPAPLQAAVAKARCSEAVVPVATIAHAVHGAIGVTYEYDLHLLTRRLHEWRLAAGAETYWQEIIGAELLAQNASTLDFIRQRIAAPTP